MSTTPVGVPCQYFSTPSDGFNGGYPTLPALYYAPSSAGSDDNATLVVFTNAGPVLRTALTVSTWTTDGSNPNVSRWQTVPNLSDY
jgi:hypothetical protein